MASLHQRNRIVVFRLSQEEYSSLRLACVAAGSRNLSDFTRTELLTLVQPDPRESLIERKFMEIDRRGTRLLARTQFQGIGKWFVSARVPA